MMQTLELLLLVGRPERAKVGRTSDLHLPSAMPTGPWQGEVGAGYLGYI